MRYELDYEYSDELMRSAMKRSALGNVGWPVGLAILVAVVWTVCESEGWGYLCGFLQGALIVLVVLFVLIRTTAAEQALRFARKLPTRAARCVFDEEAMTVENALAATVLKWPVVQKVVRRREVWLFFLARGQFMALPADILQGEVGAFIEARVTAAGGKMQ
jgi:MFS family permease